MAFFLGIDGGGSKTACAIGDEASLLGTGTSAGSNIVRVGQAQARQSLHAAIVEACEAARVSPSGIRRACVGVAGAARPEISEVVHRLIAEIIAGEVEVVGDMEIALEAAFAGGPGVIVIAGTGSIAYGRDASGQTARAGGWGFAISDEGSGHWIGRAAVAAAVRDGDQSRDTCLLKAIAKSWGVTTHQQVVLAANGNPAPNFAALLPVVLKAAEKNNRQARAVVTQAAEELATLAKRVVERLFSASADVPVAMSGGVFANSSLAREVFYNSLHAACSRIRLIPVVVEPVHGALQRARKRAG
jgi:glucosamine kinase